MFHVVGRRGAALASILLGTILLVMLSSSATLGRKILPEPLVTETYADAAIYWPGAL